MNWNKGAIARLHHGPAKPETVVPVKNSLGHVFIWLVHDNFCPVLHLLHYISYLNIKQVVVDYMDWPPRHELR
jgi:hypothetical protein